MARKDQVEMMTMTSLSKWEPGRLPNAMRVAEPQRAFVYLGGEQNVREESEQTPCGLIS